MRRESEWSLVWHAYDCRMKSKGVRAKNSSPTTKWTGTAEFVGYVAPEVPDAALEGLLGKLLARSVDLERTRTANPKHFSTRPNRR